MKWAGGKGRLLSQLRPLLPPGVACMRHVEPFVGGGALFFARAPERALLTDINPALVATYAAIRNDVQNVIQGLRGLAGHHSKESYYQVRERYNEGHRLSASTRAAMFIYLNKTCFNGLHRVNRKGEFNVPVGSYKNPRILNENGLYAASYALQAVHLACVGFESLLESAKPGDFVYFDPPYEPVSETARFTSYARNGFTREDQTRLRDVYHALDRRGCKLMLSNSDVPFIRELYQDFRTDTVAAPRAINCNAKKRGKVSEVVVRNY
ncbi:MAG: DNA adenine methylase [Deltaproteobacteria bacterium]|nr:DNA adenine methylase [Deltaproteobacteria bacterium]